MTYILLNKWDKSSIDKSDKFRHKWLLTDVSPITLTSCPAHLSGAAGAWRCRRIPEVLSLLNLTGTALRTRFLRMFAPLLFGRTFL